MAKGAVPSGSTTATHQAAMTKAPNKKVVAPGGKSSGPTGQKC
jgi:hypothetical protein